MQKKVREEQSQDVQVVSVVSVARQGKSAMITLKNLRVCAVRQDVSESNNDERMRVRVGICVQFRPSLLCLHHLRQDLNGLRANWKNRTASMRT